MCGGAWTVAPHRYRPAFPGVRGRKSRTVRVAVSCRRSVICQGYGMPGGLLLVEDDLVRRYPDDHPLLTWPVPERLAGVFEGELTDQFGIRIVGDRRCPPDLGVGIGIRSVVDQRADLGITGEVCVFAPAFDRGEQDVVAICLRPDQT